MHTIERNDAGRQKRRLPDEAFRDRLVRFGEGPYAGGRRRPVRGEQPAMAGRRDGGTLGRLPGPVVRHPSTRTASRSPASWTGTTSACTSRRTRCWCGPSRWPAGGWKRKCCTSTAWTGALTPFAWRDDQTDADLVPADGAEKEMRDGKQKRSLAVPQPQPVHVVPQQLVGIRAGVPARAIEPTRAGRPQPTCRLYRDGADPPGRPRTASLLPPFDAASAAKERKLADPADASQPLEARARAYLHANCGHCHCDGGGGAVGLRLQYPSPSPR